MNSIELIRLNFPENYQFRLKQKDEIDYIFCPIRKKWLQLSPEEWVRQHCIQFLIQSKNYSKSSINSEVEVVINSLKKRADLVVFKKEKPFLIVECKAPSVAINQAVFDQIARYNMQLKSDYLMVSNGLQHYYCQMDYENKTYIFLPELPDNSL
ncbi:MAG: type I restriction enzyme HsdR N-terminal domain-containing protein [Weeksellaceae bacterium]|nr:type I restriction enzyme HsdR N-terminal domain-containing protein [Weeksellaceae bacterium]